MNLECDKKTDLIQEHYDICSQLHDKYDLLIKDIGELTKLTENLKSTNSMIVNEYKDKMIEMTTLNAELEKRNSELITKMELLITQNTRIFTEKRVLKASLQKALKELYDKKTITELNVLTADDETFRAKLEAQLELKYRNDVEKIRTEFSSKFEDLRKSIVRVKPLNKKK
jgi:hypothetical protein